MRDKISGMTPLAVACEEQRTAYVMEANSDVDAIRFMAPLCKELLESEDGIETPLHSVCSKLAAWSRSSVSRIRTLSIIQALAISEKAVTAKNSLGCTPLHLLARGGASREFMQIIIEQFPTAAGVKDNDGRIPLHAAVEACSTAPSEGAHAHGDIVHYLLKTFLLGVHVADSNGVTPLMLSCELDVSLDIIYELVKMDPMSNKETFEWSQVPHPFRRSKNLSSSIWKGLLSAVCLLHATDDTE